MRNSIKSGCMDNRSSGWLIHDRFIHWMKGKTVGLSDGMLIEKINQQKLSCGGFFLLKKKVLRGIFILYIFRLHINIHQL